MKINGYIDIDMDGVERSRDLNMPENNKCQRCWKHKVREKGEFEHQKGRGSYNGGEGLVDYLDDGMKQHV